MRIRCDRRAISLFVPLAIFVVAGGCAPPPELSEAEEALVRNCLELEHKQETSDECASVSGPMRKAFLAKNPDFYDRLIAERKQFVEERIAEDVQRRDELNTCVDQREGGNAAPRSCEKFMPHEITRAIEDRRRRGCAKASLDGEADAPQKCKGLAASEIEEEVQMERNRREWRR